MASRSVISAAVGVASIFLLETRGESNPHPLQADERVAEARAFVAGSGLSLLPPQARIDPEFAAGAVSDPATPADVVRARFAHRAHAPQEVPAIGDWSELVAGPPSERLHQSSTYDPVRKRLIVFGGLAHVWVDGDLSYLSLAEPGTWHHVNPENSPPTRWGHSAIYDPVRDRIVIFGGMGPFVPFGDVWSLALGTFTWTELHPAGRAPSARFVHSAIYDPEGDRMIVFGGFDGRFLNDVWELRLDGNGTWRQLAPGGAVVPRLDAAAAAYDPLRKRMLVFGGFDGSTSRNEVWSLALGDTPSWSQILPAGDLPAVRRQHAVAYDSMRDRVLVFGGTEVTEGPGYNDVWALDLGDSPAWSFITPAGDPPSPRWGHSLVYDPDTDRALLFAGVDLQDWRNDTWQLNLARSEWIRLGGALVAPAARWGHSGVLDTARDRLLVFMGAAQSRWMSDTWALDLSETGVWHPVAIHGIEPDRRQDATAVLDAGGDRVILYGGRRWEPFGDLWELSLLEQTWSPLEALGDPPLGRSAHSAILDPLRHRMIVFGGSTALGPSAEAWALSLTGEPTWTRLEAGGQSPEARLAHSAVYDGQRDRMLVFGGRGLVDYDDVWALSLADPPLWTRIAASGSPGARYGHAAVWDAAHDRMLIFGGESNTGLQNDAWALSFPAGADDHGVWTALDPSGMLPAERGGHSAVLDADRNSMLVFGGKNAASFLDDTAALDLGPARLDRNAATQLPQAIAILRAEMDARGSTLQAVVQVPGPAVAHCRVVDVRGRRVAECDLDGGAGERRLDLDLAQAPRGVYWLRVEQDGRVGFTRFVRIHR